MAVQFLLCTTNLTAQSNLPFTDKFYVQHFGEAEGMKNSIYDILPDKDGFLWVTTANGIFRFNGTRCSPVSIADKGIFYGTVLLHYKNDDTIIASSAVYTNVAQIADNRVFEIKLPKKETRFLYFSNQKYIVPYPAFISDKTGIAELIKKYKWNTSANSFSLVGGSCNKDIIWVATYNGIIFYNNNGVVNKINIPEIDAEQIATAGKYIVYLDKHNYLNYYTLDGLQKRELINIPAKSKLIIQSNRLGDGFYCMADSCLYKATISASGKLMIHKLLADLKCSPENISAIVEKDSNTIVIGTINDGLYIHKKNVLSVSEPLPKNQSNTFFIQQLLPDSQTVLAGSGYLFKNGHYTNKQMPGFDKVFFGIYKDSKNRYWYAIDGAVVRTRKLGEAPDTIIHLNGRTPEILLEDNAGRIWVTSDIDFGYFQNDKYTAVNIPEFAGRWISCMKQDATGKYYVGADLGLFVLDDIHHSSVKEIAAFKSAHVRDIIFEPAGSIWIFTYGNGFFLMEKDKITSFSGIKNNLAFVHTLIEDSRGYCWLPSNNGLFVTLKQSLIEYSKDNTKPPYFYQFSIKDGIRTNELNGGTSPPYLRLPNGDISLTSMDGLVFLEMSKAYFTFSTSSIMVDHIFLDSTEVEEKNGFDISNNVKNIHFEIFTSYWGNEENAILEYQVIKSNTAIDNSQWVSIDPSGRISLFSPGYGNYQLVVRKRTGFGADDYLYKKIGFRVLPKWYETKTFLAAIILGSIAIMIGILFWRREYYRRANRILKEKVDTATLELQQMNNTLEKKVEERTWTIQEAEKKFRTLVEKSLVGVYIIQDNKFLYVNPRHEEIFGYDSGELHGKNPLIIIKEDLRAIVNEKIMQRISGEIDSEHYETTGVKKDGEERLLEFYASRTMYEGKPTIIGTVLDITDKKLLEQEITEQKVQEQKKITRAILQGEERERNKIGQELHDNINQILAATKLSLSRAKKATTNKEDVIAEAMQLIDNVIEEIRALSRDKVTPVKKIDLQELLQSLIETITLNYAINVTLVFHGKDNQIKDELKLNVYRITQELLNNILKHSMANNVTVFIEASASQIILSVSDDGKGFDAEMQRNGIGISNIINRVESFNGHLAIESSPGNGSRTDVTFPVFTPAQPA